MPNNPAPVLGQKLTPSELRVMQRLVNLDSEGEVAKSLCLSTRTVNFHTANVRAKMGTGSTKRALLMLVKSGAVHV